jgi:hypothetical protein
MMNATGTNRATAIVRVFKLRVVRCYLLSYSVLKLAHQYPELLGILCVFCLCGLYLLVTDQHNR